MHHPHEHLLHFCILMVFYVLHAVITRLHLHLYEQDFCISLVDVLLSVVRLYQ